MATTNPPVALTIAGSDSGGGAGIQADLKTFAAHGVFGTSVLTAVTAQNTVGVAAVEVLPVGIVDAQITAVVDDLAPAAAKTGMLATAGIVDLVARRAAAGELPNLVVDPVMVAASGDRLSDDTVLDAYRDRLFRHARVVTPNLHEASLLVARELHTVDDMTRAACELVEAGAEVVVVKGGHLDGDAVDVIAAADGSGRLTAPRIDTRNNHGTGCTFAAAIAAGLATGREVDVAVRDAKSYVHRALSSASRWELGAGRGPVDHLA